MARSRKSTPGKKAMFEESKHLESKGLRQKLGAPPAKNPQIRGKELDTEAAMGKMPGKKQLPTSAIKDKSLAAAKKRKK